MPLVAAIDIGTASARAGIFDATGRLLAVGPAGDLQGVARRRLARASTPAERAWWQEVVGALAR